MSEGYIATTDDEHEGESDYDDESFLDYEFGEIPKKKQRKEEVEDDDFNLDNLVMPWVEKPKPPKPEITPQQQKMLDDFREGLKIEIKILYRDLWERTRASAFMLIEDIADRAYEEIKHNQMKPKEKSLAHLRVDDWKAANEERLEDKATKVSRKMADAFVEDKVDKVIAELKKTPADITIENLLKCKKDLIAKAETSFEDVRENVYGRYVKRESAEVRVETEKRFNDFMKSPDDGIGYRRAPPFHYLVGALPPKISAIEGTKQMEDRFLRSLGSDKLMNKTERLSRLREKIVARAPISAFYGADFERRRDELPRDFKADKTKATKILQDYSLSDPRIFYSNPGDRSFGASTFAEDVAYLRVLHMWYVNNEYPITRRAVVFSELRFHLQNVPESEMIDSKVDYYCFSVAIACDLISEKKKKLDEISFDHAITLICDVHAKIVHVLDPSIWFTATTLRTLFLNKPAQKFHEEYKREPALQEGCKKIPAFFKALKDKGFKFLFYNTQIAHHYPAIGEQLCGWIAMWYCTYYAFNSSKLQASNFTLPPAIPFYDVPAFRDFVLIAIFDDKLPVFPGSALMDSKEFHGHGKFGRLFSLWKK